MSSLGAFREGRHVNQGLSLRFGFCFAKTLSGGLLHMVSPEGGHQGLGSCCSFLSSYSPPAWGTASALSVLPSTSVKCQNKSICKGNRLSLECDGQEKSSLGHSQKS